MKYHKLKMTVGFIGVLLIVGIIILLSVAGACILVRLTAWVAGIYSNRECMEIAIRNPITISISFLLLSAGMFFIFCLFFSSTSYYFDHRKLNQGDKEDGNMT